VLKHWAILALSLRDRVKPRFRDCTQFSIPSGIGRRGPQQATTFDLLWKSPEQLRVPRYCARDGRTPENVRLTAFGAVSGLVALHNRTGNFRPGKSLFGGNAAVAAHPASPFEIVKQGAEAPADGINRRIDFQAVDVVPDKLVRPAIFRGDDRLAGRPAFQGRDSKWLVAARQADGIGRFV
jgi:hypothetical protein